MAAFVASVCFSAYLSSQDAVHHHDDEALERVEDGEEDLEKSRAPVCDGQHGGHPGQSQQGEYNARAPQRRTAGTQHDVLTTANVCVCVKFIHNFLFIVNHQ